MARKKTGEKPMPAEAETKPVRLDLSVRGHRLLKIISSYSDMSMAAYARDRLEKHLEEEAKQMGIKP